MDRDPNAPRPADRDHEDDDRWLADLPNDLGPISLTTDPAEAHPASPDAWDLANLSGDSPSPRHRHDDCGL